MKKKEKIWKNGMSLRNNMELKVLPYNTWVSLSFEISYLYPNFLHKS
jgi:hypothetical protein